MNKWEKIGAIVFGGIAVSVTIWMIGDHFGLEKNSWAAWVQAIGSIAAIIGAYIVGERQASASRRQAAENAAREARDRKQAIKAIVTHASESISSLEESARKMPPEVFRSTFLFPVFPLEESVSALSAIPLHELASYDSVAALLGLQNGLKKVIASCERFSASAPNPSLPVSEQKPPYVQLFAISDLLGLCAMANFYAQKYFKSIE